VKVDRDFSPLTLDAVHPDNLVGPIFTLLAAAPLFPRRSGLFVCTFSLQFVLAEGDPRPQVSFTLETGPAGVTVAGGTDEGTQGGLLYAAGGVPLVMTGVAKGVAVANVTEGQAAPGTYSLAASGIAKAPLRMPSVLAIALVDAVSSMSSLILTMAAVELP
jgi:hypothetical protein